MMLANLQRIAAMMDAEALDAAPHLIADATALDQHTPPQPQTEPNPPISAPDGRARLN